MIIGMRGHDLGRMEPEALSEAIASLGFRATQLAFTKCFPAPAEAYMVPERLRAIRENFRRRSIALPVMGCYVSAGDRDDAARKTAAARFKEALRASVILGAGCVGTETTHFSGSEEERKEALFGLCSFASNVAQEAEACGAMAALEPVALHTLNTPEQTARLLCDVDSDHLGVILDLANLLTPEGIAPEAQMELLHRCIACFGDRVLALHVKDGVFDAEGVWQNRPLGQGIVDWARLLPRMRDGLPGGDALCALREGVWPGYGQAECRLMTEWSQL